MSSLPDNSRIFRAFNTPQTTSLNSAINRGEELNAETIAYYLHLANQYITAAEAVVQLAESAARGPNTPRRATNATNQANYRPPTPYHLNVVAPVPRTPPQPVTTHSQSVEPVEAAPKEHRMVRFAPPAGFKSELYGRRPVVERQIGHSAMKGSNIAPKLTRHQAQEIKKENFPQDVKAEVLEDESKAYPEEWVQV